MNPLRDALSRKSTLVGMQSFSANPVFIEIMGYAGLDWVCIDLEHAPTSIEGVGAAVEAARATGLISLVRVPNIDATLIGKVLDLGADGLVVPHFESREDAEAVMDAVLYPPAGNRSACSSVRSARYGLSSWLQHSQTDNERISVVPLLESADAFDNLDQLMDLPDLFPAFWVGGRDLAQHMGVPGADLLSPELRPLCDKLIQAAQQRSVAVMATVSPHLTKEYANDLKDVGFRLLSFGTDETVFAKTCQSIGELST
ncbi:MAG: aldolase/citrate lyase family protein [Trueperaceae bacterium]